MHGDSITTLNMVPFGLGGRSLQHKNNSCGLRMEGKKGPLSKAILLYMYRCSIPNILSWLFQSLLPQYPPWLMRGVCWSFC